MVGRREQGRGQGGELVLELPGGGQVPLGEGPPQLRRSFLQRPELLQELAGVDLASRVAVRGKAHPVHEGVALRRIAECERRRADLQRADQVVVPGGHHGVGSRRLLHQVGERGRLGSGDQRRVHRVEDRGDHRPVALVAGEQPDRPAVLDQRADEASCPVEVAPVDLLGPCAVVVAAVEVHDTDADRARRTRGRARRRRRQGEGEVRVDLVTRGVHAHRPHRVAGQGVPVRPVAGQPRRPAHQGPGGPVADRGGANADQRDPGAEQPAARAEQEQRVREAPRPQRQCGLQDAHARHDHHVVPAHPGSGTDGVDEFAQALAHDRARPRRGPVLPAVPVQPRRGDAVPGRDDLGSAAQRVHDRPRVLGAEVAEHGLQ